MPKKGEKPARQPVPLYAKVAGAVVSLVVFCLAVELALRAVDANLYYKNQFFPINRDIDFTEVYKKDPDLFWRFRTDLVIDSERFSHIHYRINSEGRRGPETLAEKPDLRVLALGNSCTFGWGIPHDHAWTYLLEELLELNLPIEDAEVINAGVPGYTSYQGKVYLEQELLELNPDVILIMFGWNDHWAAGEGIGDAEQEMPSEWVLTVHNLVSPLKMYQLMRKVVLTLSEDEKQVPLDEITTRRRVTTDEFFMNLKSMAQMARSRDALPVLLVPPIASLEGYFGNIKSTLHKLHERYQFEVKRVGTVDSVAVVDLQTAFDDYNDLFADPHDDPIHFNGKGQAVTAVAVAETLVPLLSPQQPADSTN